MKKNKKILVAMSGGVDSSVAAALLKNQGHDVIGVFIFFESKEKTRDNLKSCCSLESLQTAKRVAQILDIPFYTLNMTVDFKKLIINDFIEQYRIGNTPNPCIRCNKYLKFGKLLDFAKKLGCSHIATGHYARVVSELPARPAGGKFRKHVVTPAFRPDLSELKLGVTNKNKKYKLVTAKDKSKDQSYFLYELTQDKLKHILFPLGNLKKDKVKKLAKKFGLPVYQRKESSDVCFLSVYPEGEQSDDEGSPSNQTGHLKPQTNNKNNLRSFLSAYIKTNPGDIINTQGKIIGQHIGLPFYTLGQRQGINIGGTGPYYVIKKDFEKNQLVVTNNPEDPQLFSNKIIIKNINWISEKEPELLRLRQGYGGQALKCLAQHRYQTKLSPVYVNVYVNDYVLHPVKSPTQGRGVPTKSGQFNRVKFKKPQRAVTPGQSIVFYKPVRKFFNQDFEILGGGIISDELQN